jgi:hypothetical protein
MACNQTVIKQLQVGNQKLIYGTFELTEDDETGTIDLTRYLHSISYATIQLTGDAVSDPPAINESLSGQPPRIDKSTFAFVCTANSKGLFYATGV